MITNGEMTSSALFKCSSDPTTGVVSLLKLKVHRLVTHLGIELVHVQIDRAKRLLYAREIKDPIVGKLINFPAIFLHARIWITMAISSIVEQSPRTRSDLT